MKITLYKKGLPRNWGGAAGDRMFEADISLIDMAGKLRSKLKLKLMVFKNGAQMRAFYDRFLRDKVGGGLGRWTRGFVNALAVERFLVQPDGRETNHELNCDPRYFAMMGLTKGNLGMEVITHESVHAAFAYAKRVRTRDMFHGAVDHDEESVCYPAGMIAAEVVRRLREGGVMG
jgi:hypothetical protein